MTHTHREDQAITPQEQARHRRAVRIMIVVLIPLAVWTLVGLIALWPRDVASHVNPDVANYNVPRVSYPTGRITNIAAMSCEGMAGSTPGVESGTCAKLSVEVLDGEERGTTVEVQLTDAVFASGVSIGQEVKLIRVPPMDGQPAGYQFSDFERRTPLVVITLIFVAVVISVARWREPVAVTAAGGTGAHRREPTRTREADQPDDLDFSDLRDPGEDRPRRRRD